MGVITYQETLDLIETGLQTWDEVKKTFSPDTELTAFLRGAYPVVCLDHHQLDMKIARNLYTSVLPTAGGRVDESFRKELERREAFRLKMVHYFENQAKSVRLEVRFGSLRFEFIEKLKRNNLIKDFNNSGKESIVVVLAIRN